MKEEKPKPQIPNPKEIPNPKSQRPGDGGKPYDLRERTFQFARRVLDIVAVLPESPEARIVRQQLADAASSIGANVEEADGAISKADTRRSFTIARKEARETRYWLRIIQHRWGTIVRVDSDVAESTEWIYILSSIISKLE